MTEDTNFDGEINYGDDPWAWPVITQQGIEATPETINCKYCYKDKHKYYFYEKDGSEIWFTHNPTGKLISVNAKSMGLEKEMLENDSAINYYKEALEFSGWIKETFKDGISANTMIKPDGKAVSILTDPSDVYYIFKDDTTDILNPINDNAAFTQHKLNVMQASITYNLNVAITNYAGTSGIDFRMPEMSETEWNKILTNISMVSFVQGMPIGFKTYNNYAVVTSTNNQMYVTDESIYYVANSSNEEDSSEHHRANCSNLTGDNLTGYASVEFDKYTVNYQTEYEENEKTKALDHYLDYYRHRSLDCYNCIVNKTASNEEGLSVEIEKAKLHAQARIKYNQYKVTQYVNNKKAEQN